MLDEQLTERILSKLALDYGVRFAAMYEGMDMASVRRNWAKELDGVSREGVLYAMANLPDRFPPNVLEFRKLCQSRRTEASRLALPPPKPAGMSEAMRDHVERVRQRQAEQHPRAWAKRLRQRELACEKLTPTQREMWRDALRQPVPPKESDE